jgi:hypothetical protein
VSIATVLVAAVSLTGCARGGQKIVELAPGDEYTTQSGLTLTIPHGASATMTIASRDGVQPNGAFSEFVDVRLDDSLAVAFMSYSGREHEVTEANTVASGSGAVVFEPESSSPKAIVETNLNGFAFGQASVIVPIGGTSSVRGLDLARSAWERLSVRGAVLPSADASSSP